VALFRLYAYRRSTGEGIRKEFGDFPWAAAHAGSLSVDPDIVYVTLGEVVDDPSGLVTDGPEPVLFIPVEEHLWKPGAEKKPTRRKRK